MALSNPRRIVAQTGSPSGDSPYRLRAVCLRTDDVFGLAPNAA
jgi:hypothetical protein